MAKPADVKVPLQAHFANRDDWCTPEAVNKFEGGLKAERKVAEVFRYDADHGFVNEQRDAHDRAAAELSWERNAGVLGQASRPVNAMAAIWFTATEAVAPLKRDAVTPLDLSMLRLAPQPVMVRSRSTSAGPAWPLHGYPRASGAD